MPPAGFEPTISAGERSQTYALDRAVTGTGNHTVIYILIIILSHSYIILLIILSYSYVTLIIILSYITRIIILSHSFIILIIIIFHILYVTLIIILSHSHIAPIILSYIIRYPNSHTVTQLHCPNNQTILHYTLP